LFFSSDKKTMVKSFSNVLKGQRVDRRQASWTVRGNTALQTAQNSRQYVSPKRMNPSPYRQTGKNVPFDTAAPRVSVPFVRNVEQAAGEQAEQALWEASFYKEFSRKQDGEAADTSAGSPSPAVFDSVETWYEGTYEAPRLAQMPHTMKKPSGRRWIKTGYHPENEQNTEKSYKFGRSAVSDTAEDAGTSGFWQKLAGKLSPQMMLIVLSIAALCFFAYNALLWQNDAYLIQPSPDARIRRQVLDFASGNGAGYYAEDINPDIQSDMLPVNTSETFEWQHYSVRKGDSVSKIAADHSLSMDAVIASNNMKNAKAIREGDVLRIPNMDGVPYTAAGGDSYEKIAEKFGVPLNAIVDANDIQSADLPAGAQIFIPGAKMRSEDLKMALGELYIFPVQGGRISSNFGWRKDPFTGERRYHNALDIAANSGVTVKATSDGKVTTAGFSPVFGNYIIVSHANAYQSMYAHLSVTSVKQGVRVSQGQKIGEVGNTGHSTGPHLHFAVYKNGRAVNPLELLKL
jgi:murein DD-endopeptidase MepM/ murein hydrolase activator NlpD